MLYDNRKNTSVWSFYVVDHLPSMANIYRYDSLVEAIAKYSELPTHKKSAIGASFAGMAELDLVHRAANNTPVFVMDCLRSDNPVWKLAEIRQATESLLSCLKVAHQYDHSVFGNQFPSVVVELEPREEEGQAELNSYFNDKVLNPRHTYPVMDNNFLSSVDEVFVEGEGWLNAQKFLDLLDDSRPSKPGEARRDVFVSRLSVRYKDDNGSVSYMDVSPREFKALRGKTIEKALEQKKTALSDRITSAKEKQSSAGTSRISRLQADPDIGNNR